MKPFWGIDVTLDKKNEVLNGSEFITQTLSEEKTQALQVKQDKFQSTVKKSELPLWLKIFKCICGFLFLIIAAAVIENLDNLGQAYRNAPYLFIICGASGLLWLILQIYSGRKKKTVFEEEDVELQTNQFEQYIQSAYEELGVPTDATSVDVLMFKYKVKDGNICPYSSPLAVTSFINITAKLYATDEALHLSDIWKVFSFKKSELRAIKTVQKKISVPFWHKAEKPTKGIYKPYKITCNNLNIIFFKPYHILELEHEGQLFGIYFPCYELDNFERLSGLTAEHKEQENAVC